MNDYLWASIYFRVLEPLYRGEMLAVTKSQLKKLIKKWGIGCLLAACVICGIVSYVKNRQVPEQESSSRKDILSSFLGKQMEEAYFLLPGYIETCGKGNDPAERMERLLLEGIPVYAYFLEEEEGAKETEDDMIAEMILKEEGMDEDRQNIEEEQLDYQENALHIENSILEEMARENGLHNSEEATEGVEKKDVNQEDTGNAEGENGSEELADITGEAETAFAGESFIAASYPSYSYDWSENWDYEMLVSNFYAVDNSTSLQEDYLDLDLLLYRDLSVDKTVEGPQILIYHTHAHEAFEDSVEGDESTTIVGAGEKLATLLEEEYGFRVLHHKGVYDDVREDAYAEALPAIEKILEENPTIEVVIDLHRDGMSGDRKLVMDLQGKPTARFMFFNGLSYTKKGGGISYLENPYIQENLAFSFQAQVAANEYYPGIARKVYLKAYRYNMHLKPKTMLIELGAQNNTVEEIMNACDPLAHILAIVLDDVV